MQQLIEYYSEIGFVVALPFVSDEPEERRVCPEVYKGCSFGLYSSKQIVSCKDPGIVVWKGRLEAIGSGNSMYTAQSKGLQGRVRQRMVIYDTTESSGINW